MSDMEKLDEIYPIPSRKPSVQFIFHLGGHLIQDDLVISAIINGLSSGRSSVHKWRIIPSVAIVHELNHDPVRMFFDGGIEYGLKSVFQRFLHNGWLAKESECYGNWIPTTKFASVLSDYRVCGYSHYRIAHLL